tara:strand:- start:248 stop:997 length:750 start_codon:yes stop_codon:yes gene_type:complete
MKILYIHVPKTAGSSINKYFSNNLKSHRFHIEGINGLNKDICESYEFISGHLPYNVIDKMLPLEEWITLISFREPVSYVISHLSWVRQLADQGEEERFNAHPKPFQRIARKMTEYNFSNPDDLSDLITWLEDENLLFLHNTQMYFLNGEHNRSTYSHSQVNAALKNLESIDLVGIQEDINQFMNMLSMKFEWPANQVVMENVSHNKYGLDINDDKITKALFPLYDKDVIVYEKAKKIFEQQAESLSKID